MQGSLVGWGQEICYILALACVLTEGIKFAQGMQGGETGTGEPMDAACGWLLSCSMLAPQHQMP